MTTEKAKASDIALGFLVIIVIAALIIGFIWWIVHQWNTCMEVIGDVPYCIQHIL